MTRPLSRASEALLVGLIGIVCVAAFFYAQILNHFTFLFGDRFDAVIEASILEHWYNFFRGFDVWDQTAYFYPHAGTLAYNDGYFLYGTLYSVFRWGGSDPLLASEQVNIAIKLVGYAGFYLVARVVVKLNIYWASLAAIVLTLSNNMLVHAIHAQLLSICFAPILILLGAQAAHGWQMSRTPQLLGWGVAAAVFYAAWLMTAYYMAWFFAFYALVFLIFHGSGINLRL